MTLTLSKEHDITINASRTEHIVYNVFKMRGILDPHVYKDENSLRLLGNYRAIFSYLSEHYESVWSYRTAAPPARVGRRAHRAELAHPLRQRATPVRYGHRPGRLADRKSREHYDLCLYRGSQCQLRELSHHGRYRTRPI